MTKNNLKRPNRASICLIALGILFSSLIFPIHATYEPARQKITIECWGQEVNGISLGFGFDRKQWKDITSDRITVKFAVKNNSKLRKCVEEIGLHKGIYFFTKSGNGNAIELLGTSSLGGLSHSITFVNAGTVVPLYLNLKKDEMQSLMSEEAFADLTINEGEIGTASPIAPFHVQVALPTN
jgi:hypothetical protein